MMRMKKRSSSEEWRRGHIKAGQLVQLGWQAGLGPNPFLVLDVNPKSLINDLYVRGTNGTTWWTRSDGAVVL